MMVSDDARDDGAGMYLLCICKLLDKPLNHPPHQLAACFPIGKAPRPQARYPFAEVLDAACTARFRTTKLLAVLELKRTDSHDHVLHRFDCKEAMGRMNATRPGVQGEAFPTTELDSFAQDFTLVWGRHPACMQCWPRSCLSAPTQGRIHLPYPGSRHPSPWSLLLLHSCCSITWPLSWGRPSQQKQQNRW